MILSGTTVLSVNGKVTRILGSRFNHAIRSHRPVTIMLATGDVVKPSKGLGWPEVARMIRAGKKVQAAVVK